MKKLIYYSLIALLLFTMSSAEVYAGKFGMFTEFLGPKQQLTQFYVPGGPNNSDPYKVIIAFHPYNTPPEAILQMVMPSAEHYNAILACPNVHPDYEGDITENIMQFLNENYSIDNENLVLSGYSAGGVAMFDYGLPNHSKVKGLIGIAPSIAIYQSDYQYLDKLPISVIVGTNDQLHSGSLSLKQAVENRGGSFLLVEKQGVAHTGAYFYSMEFTDDWNQCYDFIQSWMPKVAPITLLSPENGAENFEIQLDFSWEDTELVDSYKIQISENLQFDPILEEDVTTGTEYTSKRLKNGKRYYWRVCGSNSSGNGLWSTTWEFTTIPAAPPAAVLASPQNGAVNVLFPVVLHWNSVESADKYIVRLWVKGEEEPLLEAEHQEYGMESYVQTATCNPGTEYKWVVETINISGSAISDYWEFTTLPELEGSPELLYPEDNTEKLPIDIEFRWRSLDKAESYYIQIFESGNENPVFEKQDIKSSSQLVKTSIKVESGKSYEWHVCGVNNAGIGTWSEMRTFQTDGTNSIIDDFGDEFEAYPNPFSSEVSINFEYYRPANAKIRIIDQCGSIVYSDNLNIQEGSNSFRWNPKITLDGIYIYTISIEGKHYISGKLIHIK